MKVLTLDSRRRSIFFPSAPALQLSAESYRLVCGVYNRIEAEAGHRIVTYLYDHLRSHVFREWRQGGIWRARLNEGSDV